MIRHLGVPEEANRTASRSLMAYRTSFPRPVAPSSPSWLVKPDCDALDCSHGATSRTQRRAGLSCTRTRLPPGGPRRASTSW